MKEEQEVKNEIRKKGRKRMHNEGTTTKSSQFTTTRRKRITTWFKRHSILKNRLIWKLYKTWPR